MLGRGASQSADFERPPSVQPHEVGVAGASVAGFASVFVVAEGIPLAVPNPAAAAARMAAAVDVSGTRRRGEAAPLVTPPGLPPPPAELSVPIMLLRRAVLVASAASAIGPAAAVVSLLTGVVLVGRVAAPGPCRGQTSGVDVSEVSSRPGRGGG